jgi:hypothetical protein
MWEAMKAGFRMGSGKTYFREETLLVHNDEELDVYVNNDLFLAQGVEKDTLGACLLSCEVFILVVNDGFMAAPRFVRDAVIEHEKAHWLLGHARGSKCGRILKNIIRMVHEPAEEFHADAVAAMEVGAVPMMMALQYIKNQRKGWLVSRGLNRRIAALEEI